MAQRILLVEDDRSIREVIRLGLEQAGFAVAACADGRQGLDRFGEGGYDLVLLDVMLPGIDGLELCRRIRARSGVPVVMLTARDATVDVVVGLELGADDYLTKPFELPVLVARLRAVLRRGARSEHEPLRFGPLEIDGAAHRATMDGTDLGLTTTEFRLLAELAGRPSQVFTRALLLEMVWGYDYLGDSRLVDVAVQRLRAKLGAQWITTVRGVGYRFDPKG